MKFTRPLVIALAFAAMGAISLRAEDWTATDGKVYQNVTVVKLESDAVTILYRDGGSRIPLATLPPDLQKRFNFDPAKARVAAEAQAQTDAKSSQALQAEIEATKKRKALELAEQQAKEAAAQAKQTPANATPPDPLHSDSLHTEQYGLNRVY